MNVLKISHRLVRVCFCCAFVWCVCREVTPLWNCDQLEPKWPTFRDKKTWWVINEWWERGKGKSTKRRKKNNKQHKLAQSSQHDTVRLVFSNFLQSEMIPLTIIQKKVHTDLFHEPNLSIQLSGPLFKFVHEYYGYLCIWAIGISIPGLFLLKLKLFIIYLLFELLRFGWNPFNSSEHSNRWIAIRTQS